MNNLVEQNDPNYLRDNQIRLKIKKVSKLLNVVLAQ